MTLEDLQKICMALPATTSDVKWGNDLCFSVGGKMFCATSMDQPLRIAFKVPDEDFEELSESDGFMPAPYMARAKWVLVTKPNKLGKKDWERYIRTSYELIKSKLTGKVKKELGIQ
jgi:predicted DNA-binding protein (MmcQ/YjbR family)